MLKIFHAPRSRSHRIVWLCEEMGVPYELAAVNFRDPSADLLAVNPLKSLPALQDGAVTMIESIAMMIYIMGKYGPTDLELKSGDPAYARYLQFLLFGEAGMAMYGNPLVATKYLAPEDKRVNWTSDYLKATFAKRLGYLEDHLGGSPYIVSDRFTAADISVGYTIGMVRFATDLELSPKLQAYLERMKARPAYQRAASQGTSG
ncbi:MAG TPA: glutathione S-transferase family protein [Steroidobacteraceae bacterium]|jgi:glutathione S-transferase/3-isopropylmalate dehydratase|nr:glutathione S-transferase family protein [Steroidobacteraceae bacterium]